MAQLFSSQFLNFEVIRILGTVRYGGADIAEVLEAVSEIRERDWDPSQSWHRAWAKQGLQAESLAIEAQRHGDRSAARSAFLRASNYTRASGYLMTGPQLGTSDPRVFAILQKSTEFFSKAIALFDISVRALKIPYSQDDGKGGTRKVTLPAYLYLPNLSATKATSSEDKVPLLISMIGADSTNEEIFYMFPAAGPDLGYAVLTYQGPGQGTTLHAQDDGKSLPMRPDWEAVNQTVIDYMVSYASDSDQTTKSEPGLDIDRIAVAGATLGGYFALRSAAADANSHNRIKACVAIDPIYDLWEMVRQHVAPRFFGLWERGWVPDWLVNGAVMQGSRWLFQMRWEVFTSARFLGVSASDGTPADLLTIMKKYSVGHGKGSCLQDIKCPTLVSVARGSLYFDDADARNSSTSFRARLDQIGAEEKEPWVGDTPGTGGLQAKMGALGLCNQRVFAFLDRQFGIKREGLE
ncbi:Hydrolyase ccsE [Rhypophila decipiens]